MKKATACLMTAVVLGMCPLSFADEAVSIKNAPSTFEQYVVNPVRLVHRGVWGVLALAFKVGKAPVDAAFTLVGKALGSDPNTPLWE